MEIYKDRGISVVSIEMKVLDTNSYKAFKNELLEKVEEEGKLLLDMQSLEFVDSAGLGAILAILRSVHQKKGQIKICNVGRSVKILFDLVRLGRLLEIYDSYEEAIEAF
ncbi:STAS domain-containing protein [Spirochaeta cellobiosiphila]|uniref:STAS domain-containing protein n=1 Tax=Spirochaeta cellobiosiphila TaxID=504483 RepID=UPI0003F90D66|nr:STAS domain-containing protein [Spirochaeta cellobiosiphila]